MDLICFSHLRWNFVFQRPQHLLSRFSKSKRVFFIEEPIFINASTNELIIEKSKIHPNIFVVIPYLNKDQNSEEKTHTLKCLIDSLLKSEKISSYITWYYSPMAQAFSSHLKPTLMVYDCMDELSAFKNAPIELKNLENELLKKADLVFTGGVSLYNAKKNLHNYTYCFPSSIDKEHFESARKIDIDAEDQKFIPHPRLGFFGVIDERFNIELINEISLLRPDIQIILIGPVVKIDPASLPIKNNIHYLGPKNYSELPSYLATWDIAILPFEKNESTQFISPTKTPEYLAGGKPVISTSINDVVNPYGINGLVHIADNASDFIKAINKILESDNPSLRLKQVDAFLADNSWDNTWRNMNELIEEKLKLKLPSENTKTPLYV